MDRSVDTSWPTGSSVILTSRKDDSTPRRLASLRASSVCDAGHIQKFTMADKPEDWGAQKDSSLKLGFGGTYPEKILEFRGGCSPKIQEPFIIESILSILRNWKIRISYRPTFSHLAFESGGKKWILGARAPCPNVEPPLGNCFKQIIDFLLQYCKSDVFEVAVLHLRHYTIALKLTPSWISVWRYTDCWWGAPSFPSGSAVVCLSLSVCLSVPFCANSFVFTNFLNYYHIL